MDKSFTEIIRNILHKFKTELLDNGSIFTSEADFKYNLALKLSKEPEISNIVIEFPEKDKYVDLYCEYNKSRYYIELKYKTKKILINKCSQKIELKSHSAQNDNRYLLYRDIERLESFIENKDNAVGISLFLTNDENYWENNTPKSAINFPLCEKKTNLKNFLCEKCKKKKCNDKNRLCYLTRYGQGKKKSLKIKQAYNCNWTLLGNIKTNDDSKNIAFHYLLIEVKNKYRE